MKFSCEKCSASYMISDDKVGERGVKVRCKRCGESIAVRPVSSAEPALLPDESLNEERSAAAAVDHDAETNVGPAPSGLDFSDSLSSDAGGGFASMESHQANLAASAGLADSEEDFDEATTVGEFDPAQLDALARDLDGALSDDDSAESFAPPALEEPVAGASAEEAFSAGNFLDDASAPADFSATVEGQALSGISSGNELTLPAVPTGEGESAAMSMPDVPALDALVGANAGLTDSDRGDFAQAAGEHEEPPAPEDLPSEVAGEEDMLDDQIAGAFNDMFNDPASLPEPETDGMLGNMDGESEFSSAVEGLGMPDVGAGFAETSGSFGLNDLRDDLNESLSALDESPFPEEEKVDPLLLASGGGAENATPDDDEDVEWFVAIDDEEVGPLSLDEVGDFVAKGRLSRESLVWKTGMDDWIPADDVLEVSSFFDASAPGKYSSMLDGMPVEDEELPPPPVDNDPFSNVPDGVQDPSWQPHGLTEVYQAANLVEAAQGNVKTPYVEPEPMLPAADDDDDDAGWSPGAASALSALVENEMGRLDDPSPAASLLPADDEVGLGSNALDELSGRSASSSALGATLANLEASTAAAPAPEPTSSLPQMPAVQVAHPAAAVPSVPSLPPSYVHGGGGRSPIIYVVGGLAALLMVGAFALAAISMLNQNGNENFAPNVAVALAQKQEAERIRLASAALAKPVAAPVEGGKTVIPVKESPASVGIEKKALENKAVEDKALENKAVEDKALENKAVEAKAVVAKAERQKSVKAKARPKARTKTKAKAKVKPKPKPKMSAKRPPRRRSGDCDPVLDFDCDEKKSSKATKKKKLSKSDILAVAKKNIRKIKACGKKYGVNAKVKVRWKISRSGATRGVKIVTAKYEGSQVGSCLVRVVKKWRFPSYSGKEMKPITFPFKL